MLEDHADFLTGLAQFHFGQFSHVPAVNDHFATRWLLQHIDAANQGTFTGAG